MTDDLEHRVQSLIRLAVDAGAADNEARNAALLACKLIAKHGFHVGLKPLPSSGYREPTPRPQRDPAPPPPPRDPGDPQFWPERPEAVQYKGERWFAIKQGFSGTKCKRCRLPITEGAWCYWIKGQGCIHLACMEGDNDA